MSGLRRRAARNRAREGGTTGHRGGRNLSKLEPTIDRESWPTKVRRFVRESYQKGIRNAIGIKAGPGIK